MQDQIIDWFLANKRDLPWRNTSPWGVVVSEFMLQQTPVNRVMPVWQRWMEKWPKPSLLAAETRAEVIRAWGNLGYPRRAIRLYETAKVIATEHADSVPRDLSILRGLPGVGEYTAAAIVAFAFSERSLVLDTNIRRLFTRVVDGQQFPINHITQSERESRVSFIPKSSSLWAAATMELGALICKSQNPLCDSCPVNKSCQWRKNGYPESSFQKKRQAWHGSDRQCRGRILKKLRENETVKRSELLGIWEDKEQLTRSLKSLIDEKMIIESKQGFALRN